MTPHDLIAAFEVLAEAPEGVARLRELVLQLAVRGKLVPQDPDDEPASVLLEPVDEELVEGMNTTDSAKSKPAATVSLGETHDLPDSWVWSTLGNVVEVLDYKRVPVEKAEREARTAGKRQDELYPYYGATQQAGWIDDYIFDEELVLLGEDGAPFFKAGKGVAYVVAGRFWVNNHAHALRGVGVLNRYLCHVLNNTSYEGLVSGTTRLKLTQSKMMQIPVPIPPLAEQHRIVARVDELMGLLDRLEAARSSREGTRTALRDSALAALRDADTPDGVEAAWQRIAERMDDLFTDPADVDPLRRTVLQLAVRGRLVPQNPEDEPASTLLGSRCKSVSQEDELFPLPSGWSWSSIALLGEARGGGTPSKQNPAFWGGSIPWVSPKDMKRDFIGESQDYVTPAALDGSAVKAIPSGSLLMVVRGMILAHSFPTALTTAAVTVNQDMKALLPYRTDLGPYLLVATKGLKPDVLARVEHSGHGTCKLPTSKLFSLPIPIPPLAEQHRIVARVDEVMGLLDRLEQHLVAKTTTHDAFAAAAVHHLDA